MLINAARAADGYGHGTMDNRTVLILVVIGAAQVLFMYWLLRDGNAQPVLNVADGTTNLVTAVI